jgi:hypothetical protein
MSAQRAHYVGAANRFKRDSNYLKRSSVLFIDYIERSRLFLFPLRTASSQVG